MAERKTKRVVIIDPIAGGAEDEGIFAYRRNQIVDLPVDLARKWIASGTCKPVESLLQRPQRQTAVAGSGRETRA